MSNKSIYFVGIGGIGMSALARYFMHEGYRVGGYDRTPSFLTEQLAQEGASVHYEDNIELIGEEFRDPATTRVIYTPAVPVEVLWRVVEDPTAATTARAGAAFALRSTLDDDGKARLRIVADACAAPKLRVALDELATGEDDVADTFDALVDGDAQRRAISP